MPPLVTGTTIDTAEGRAMFVTPLFRLMAEKQASDLFFTAGAPIQIKIEGVVKPINDRALDPQQIRTICYELMTDNQIKEFETRHEMNFARDISDQVLMFDSGRVIEAGSPEKIFNEPEHDRTREFLSAVL